MKQQYIDAPVTKNDRATYERAVVNSALWAAAGDALGWITELSRGPSTVEHRTGQKHISETVAWQRLIGGRSGVKVALPAGTYSDDTQLRLCVSRSIRANGAFDVEAFAKVEVTSWQGYCLGAGIGSKAAAANLSKRGVNWFSNFFATDRVNYVTAGGNGAAMRIQPHVWSANGSLEDMALRVMRDSVVTHGHPHGFCGALFHALCLWETLATQSVPTLKTARQFIVFMGKIPILLEKDNELASFWRPAWEREAGQTLAEAISQFQDEAQRDLVLVERELSSSANPSYHRVLERLGCLTDKFRGSGFKTSLAALVLAMLHSPTKIEHALVQSANELDSDTDTIATMTGALLGSLVTHEPTWKIQDIKYLREEALRMASVAYQDRAISFSYPEMSVWEPPSNQSDAVVIWNGSMALAGIGALVPLGEEYASGSSVWQWFSLPFGQTILAKRRSIIKTSVNDGQMPREPMLSKPQPKAADQSRVQNNFEFSERKKPGIVRDQVKYRQVAQHRGRFPGIGEATDIIISSGFDDAVIGRMLNLCIEEAGEIEMAVALAAIVAKAKLVRRRRG